MRLIDADALLETLANKLPQWGFRAIDMHVVETFIKNEPTISQWISVSDRLPREGEEVLCTHKGKFGSAEQVVEHTFLDGKFVFNWEIDIDRTSPTYGEYLVGDIIAWMPLPKPYKESDE